jgi:hypothetical protein
MRSLLPYILLLGLITGCKNKFLEKPVFLNDNALLSVPDLHLQFKTKFKKWKVTLQTFTQPIPLSLQYSDTGFTATLKSDAGIVEGPAQICLSSGKQYFYYSVDLINREHAAISRKDYRSPKTVNPDSSLVQHRIMHEFDTYRNLMYTHGKLDYFFEEDIKLPPKAGISRAIKDEAITSFYMQPGSCTHITVKAKFEKENDRYLVTAGPLQDKYSNTVANGTLVAFVYNDGVQSYRMEASLLNGFANVYIPAEKNRQFSLKAIVNETISDSIKLLPL